MMWKPNNIAWFGGFEQAFPRPPWFRLESQFMSLPVAIPTTEGRGRWTAAARRRRRTDWWRWLSALRVRIGRWLLQLWRGLSRKARLRITVLVAVVLLTAPIWTLNLAVASFGRTVVFPLSPYFLKEKVAALGAYARHWIRCTPSDHDAVDQLVKEAELRHHLPRALLAAVIHVESNGFAHRISSAGAMGPGQLMPETAKLLGVADPFDTAQNIDGAARLLADHMHRFHRVRLAIAAYHAGPGAIHGHVPENGMTPGYVARVMEAYVKLRPHRARAG
jgi:soluble lytic murein transglycosylase-like protein